MAQVMTPTDVDTWVPRDTFGARLALVRQRMRWNVREAALACGQNPQSWSNWEAGAGCRNMEKVARAIADTTGCDYTWLMAGGPLRSRCVAGVPLTEGEQMEFSYLPEPVLTAV